MSNKDSIYYFLLSESYKDNERFFKVKEIAQEISLSVDRTRKNLNLLVLQKKVEMRVDGWLNTYKVKRN